MNLSSRYWRRNVTKGVEQMNFEPIFRTVIGPGDRLKVYLDIRYLDIRYLQSFDSLIGSEDRLQVYLAPPLCDVPTLVGGGRHQHAGSSVSLRGPQHDMTWLLLVI